MSDLVVTGAAGAYWKAETYVAEWSQATLLQTARMVRLDWERSVEAPGLTSCLRKLFTEGGYDPGPMARVALPRIAQYATAFRVRLKEGVWAAFVLTARYRTKIEVDVIRPDRQAASQEALRLARILVGRIRA